MSDPQRTREGAAFERSAATPHVEFSADHQPQAAGTRPRIGKGPRVRPRTRRASTMDMGVLARALGVSLVVAVVVLGGFFLLRALGFEATQANLLDHGGAPSKVAGGLVPSIAPAAMTATPGTPSPATAQPAMASEPPSAAPAPKPAAIDASRIASLLSNEPTAKQSPDESAAPNPAAISPAAENMAPAVMATAPVATAPAAPTPADFARPAFIEPPAADKADADAIDDPAPEAAAPTPATRPNPPQERAEGSGTAGRINTAINLRAAPQKGAAVLATLEAGTKITVYACKYWCEVGADGKRGYVYRRAVDQ